MTSGYRRGDGCSADNVVKVSRDFLLTSVMAYSTCFTLFFFSIIKHLLTGYSGNSRFIVPSVGTIVLGVASDNSSTSGTINRLFPSYPVNKCILLYFCLIFPYVMILE